MRSIRFLKTPAPLQTYLLAGRAAPARVRERVSSPSAVDAAPREGSEKSLRACACREAHDEHEQMQRVGTTCQR